jgi:hypothetical protein
MIMKVKKRRNRMADVLFGLIAGLVAVILGS